MIQFSNGDRSPEVHPTANVAPTAVLAGDVTVGAGAHVSFGSVVIGETSPVVIGHDSIIRENVVIRSSPGHAVTVGDNVLIGAHAALYGCTIENEAFLATGVTVFHGATVAQRAEVRIRAVVHVNTHVAAGAVVPIGWVAVGNPAKWFPPEQHEAIWAIQQTLDFPGTLYGVSRRPDGSVNMRDVTQRAVSREPTRWVRAD